MGAEDVREMNPERKQARLPGSQSLMVPLLPYNCGAHRVRSHVCLQDQSTKHVHEGMFLDVERARVQTELVSSYRPSANWENFLQQFPAEPSQDAISRNEGLEIVPIHAVTRPDYSHANGSIPIGCRIAKVEEHVCGTQHQTDCDPNGPHAER